MDDYDYKKQFLDYLYEHLGITYNDLMGYKSNLYRQLANILYYVLLEERIIKEREKNGIIIP